MPDIGATARSSAPFSAATAITVAILTVLSFITQRPLFAGRASTAGIRLIGHQWWWEVRYDGATPAEMFTTANELHIPVGTPIRLSLESNDVIHSFWVPSLAGKQDLIPGHNNSTRASRAKAGRLSRTMRGVLRAAARAYGIAGDCRGARSIRKMAGGATRRRADAAGRRSCQRRGEYSVSKPCALCHTIRGTSAGGTFGPDLTHLGSRAYIGADVLPLTPGSLAAWIADPHSVKPGVNMPPVQLAGRRAQRGHRLPDRIEVMRRAAAIPRPADQRDTGLDDAELRERLAYTWGRRPGIIGWLSTVDHKEIGRRYIITAFVFLALGGLLAAIIRLQLARPESHVVGPDLYNQIFTTHGSNMMFLFAVPVMQAFSLYLVPLMVGTRNIAFRRLGAFSYWMFLAGGVFLWVSFILDIGPDVGWFAYVPLSGPQYGIGKRPDVWAQMITFTEVAAMAAAVQTIVTVFKHRAPGMKLTEMPLFVWAMLVTAFMIIFAMPAVMVASTSLILDRLVGTHFFNPAEGGRRAFVPAPLLVLRPPRSLHHLHSRHRHGLGDHRDVRTPPGLRPYRCRHLPCRHGHARLRPLGASHVRDRPAGARRELLHHHRA